MKCEICGNNYKSVCMHCNARVATWGVGGTMAMLEMAKRKDNITGKELMDFISTYYIGRASENSDKSNVLRRSLKSLGYSGEIIGRIHTNQMDYSSMRKRELSTGHRWKLRNENCDKCGSTINLKLHHIVPLSWGGKTSTENCITLCEVCHRLTHKKLSKLLSRSLLLEYISPHKEEIQKLAVESMD